MTREEIRDLTAGEALDRQVAFALGVEIPIGWKPQQYSNGEFALTLSAFDKSGIFNESVVHDHGTVTKAQNYIAKHGDKWCVMRHTKMASVIGNVCTGPHTIEDFTLVASDESPAVALCKAILMLKATE